MRLAPFAFAAAALWLGDACAAEPPAAPAPAQEPVPAPALPAPAADSAPFLWEVRGAKATHWMMGSVHLLPAAAHPLPGALEKAYADSRALVLEADLADLSDPDLQGRMLQAAREERSGGLEASIGKTLYRKLQKRAAQLGMPTPVCADFRAWFCALTLELYPLQQAQFSVDYGVDQYFFNRAQEDGRPIVGLETAQEQIELFTRMPEALSKQVLAATLDETTYTSQTPEELYRIWRAGDAAALEKLMKEMRQRYPDLYGRLLLARNRAWVPKLVERFAADQPQLVIVGAAHFVGPEGLLALLKARGLEVRPAQGVLEMAPGTQRPGSP